MYILLYYIKYANISFSYQLQINLFLFYFVEHTYNKESNSWK